MSVPLNKTWLTKIKQRFKGTDNLMKKKLLTAVPTLAELASG